MFHSLDGHVLHQFASGRFAKLMAVLTAMLGVFGLSLLAQEEEAGGESVAKARGLLAAAILAKEDKARYETIARLAETGEKLVPAVFDHWKSGEVFVWTDPQGGARVPVILAGPGAAEARPVIRVDTGGPLAGPGGEPLKVVASSLEAVDTDRRLRKEMKNVTDLLDLASRDPKVRAGVAAKIGKLQNPEMLPYLERRLEVEENGKVKDSLAEGIAMTRLASTDKAEVIEAAGILADLNSVSGRDFIQQKLRELEGGNGDKEIIAAFKRANLSIENYLKLVDTFGTAFRGLSLGSVLLIVALGLSITFGLMGVINMAHGEMIAIGAYATYLTERMFTAWFGREGMGFELYFLFAIPFAFLLAALMGVVLERGVIQFLYKRPLESLLATWGVSLIIQQGFRLIFGAANRQVNSPRWLMGNFEVSDVTLTYNRLFVIGFAVLIVFGTWLLMTKTPIGLCIRSVMQNPQMAACMGIRTKRVRMLTFAFGSGLAGLAGAFLSQIGNVGPALGQSYSIDSFMVVVAGGAGNLIGTVISALGIGLTDQMLQPFVGPVMGKVLVLIAIILFLQWRPGGLFPTKSRALD